MRDLTLHSGVPTLSWVRERECVLNITDIVTLCLKMDVTSLNKLQSPLARLSCDVWRYWEYRYHGRDILHNYIYYIHTLISISSVGISKMFFIISFLSMSIVCHEGIFPGFTFIFSMRRKIAVDYECNEDTVYQIRFVLNNWECSPVFRYIVIISERRRET